MIWSKVWRTISKASTPLASAGVRRDVGVFVIAKSAGVAGGMIRQRAPLRTDLQNVQPIAAEAVKPGVALNAVNLG